MELRDIILKTTHERKKYLSLVMSTEYLSLVMSTAKYCENAHTGAHTHRHTQIMKHTQADA
jgi:hypothetical protein